jgi:hypothetical protein
MPCLAPGPSLDQAKSHPGTMTVHLAILPDTNLLYPYIAELLALHLIKLNITMAPRLFIALQFFLTPVTLSMHSRASSPLLGQTKSHPCTTTIHQLAIFPNANILYPCNT